MLAKNYLLNDTLTPDDIAFLLAYQETNSFLRAFNAWTGMSAQKYRQEKSWTIDQHEPPPQKDVTKASHNFCHVFLLSVTHAKIRTHRIIVFLGNCR